MRHLTLATVSVITSLACIPAHAQEAAVSEDPWQLGAVLDLGYTTKDFELAGREKGLQLGHSDITLSGPLGRHFRAQLTGVLATHEEQLEKEIEEAFVETRGLPMGLHARVGRFASQIGYLNEQHPHNDDFIERPLQYRAFFGNHWNDDGVRLNLTLPISFYWVVGIEGFKGKKLVPEADRRVSGIGAFTLSTKLGGDWNASNSWQLGLSTVKSRRVGAVEEEEEAEHEDEGAHEHEHEHHHHHGAQFGGRRTWLVDATWKWAPQGNNRQEQLKLSIEGAKVTDINRFASSGDQHQALSLSAVWHFHPEWDIGGRLDRLWLTVPHGEHFHDKRLNEQSLMVAWKPFHGQSLRLQLTRQSGDLDVGDRSSNHIVQLQYVMSLGAHGAHAY